MTIIEALRTGRPFRQASTTPDSIRGDGRWICYDPIKNNGWFYSVLNPNDPYTEETVEEIGTSLDLYHEEILSLDWEIFPC